MASIFKFSGYMVAPNDDYDAKEFMDGLIEFAAMNDMYEGPLVTEARKFEWDDDLLINDTECPDEVFEMYFDGTIKTYDDLLEEESKEEYGCDTCEIRDRCASVNKKVSEPEEDSDDEDDPVIYITIYDGVDDEDEKADIEDEKADIKFDLDPDTVALLKSELKDYHERGTVEAAWGIATLLDKMILD